MFPGHCQLLRLRTLRKLELEVFEWRTGVRGYFRDDYEGYYQNDDYQLKKQLVGAIDTSVQESVNKALAVALRPFRHPLKLYALREVGRGVHNPMAMPNLAAPNVTDQSWSHKEALDKKAKDALFDHG
ncbi:hypothetical protein NDU88_009363 [Pleurodeles waltl]|uniref:Uncharacterized protein n=1 Tax=Pleurodeles waltl TaxID=8319 RepID=A0AAV7QUY6_PLEWA|nr:hypothetical protein NDU88_009363 [Pleurodeles waltl]